MLVAAAKRPYWLCTFVVGAAAVLAYQPGLRVGFFNGWWYLEWVSSMSVPRYLVQFFDPRNVTQGYRPVQGLFVLLEYTLFKFNSDGWLLSQILLHAANGVLLFAIVEQVGKRWRLALVAALVYVVSPVFNLAVFWHAVVDPLSAFFYLLTIFLWVRYLESRRARDRAVALGAFVLALLSKETAVFLPLVLFLIEWLLYERPLDWFRLARQYAPFLILLVPYAFLDLNVQSHGEFVGQFGFTVGPHMLANLFPYLAVLTFPWLTDKPADAAIFVWMVAALIAYGAIMIYRRSRVLFFLALFAVLNVVPLLGFPLEYYNTRYLYTSMIVPAIVFAMIVELGSRYLSWRAVRLTSAIGVASAVVVAALVVASGARVADAASGLAEYTRVLRVPFRDIVRQHPTFPPDTYLYFAYPITPVSELEGLFYVRYFGMGLAVDGTDSGHPAALRDHAASYVYYFDPTGRPIELPVDPADPTVASPALPVRFQAPITLEGYQVPSALVERGQALVVILNWRASTAPDKDYGVFARFVDADGKIVAAYDGQPKNGTLPTSAWRPGLSIVDAVVVPISENVPLGANYRLELGLYDGSPARRLALADNNGEQPRHEIVIGTFTVEP